jgi:nucleoside-diphosphate-sugar epimerase
MGQTILVTGGCGYIGSVMVPLLLERGYAVRVFDKLYFGDESLRPVANRLELVPGDVRSIDDAVLDGIDGVVHLGSLSNDPTSEFHPEASYSINHRGTVRLAEACKRRGVSRFTFASTCAVYGFWLDSAADETQPPAPQSAYARSKLDAENALLQLADDSFHPVVLRQATVFGVSPRMRWDLVLNAFVMHAFRNGRLDVWFGGEAWRPLVHVQDVAAAHIACLEGSDEQVSGQVFNLVHDNFRILDLAQRVVAALKSEGYTCDLEVNRDREDSRSYKVSGEKLARYTGFRPALTPEVGALGILSALKAGRFTDFDHPAYYNMPWLTLLLAVEERLGKTGPVF